MNKAIDRTIELLPVPLLIALALVVASGWTIKEIRHLSSNGDVLRDAWFQVSCVIAVSATIAFYVSVAILARAGPQHFQKAQRGIYVAQFDGDTENKVQREAAESLIDKVMQAGTLNDVRIVRLRAILSDPDAATEVLKNSDARVAIWGSFIAPDRVHVSITTYPNGGEARVLLEKFPDVQPLTSKILDYLQLTPPAPGANAEDQISFLKKRLEMLEQQSRRPGVPIVQGSLPSETGHLRVLVVGIDRYTSPTIPPLRYAASDAMAISEIFRGQASAEVITLVGNAATRSGILDALHRLGDDAQADDTVIVYWSGIGYQADGASFLMPSDISIISGGRTPDRQSAIGISELLTTANLMRAKRVALFLDSGVTSGQSLGPPDQGMLRILFSSSAGGETAFESNNIEHSLFAYYLLKGLSGEADYNRDGVITLQEVIIYVTEKVTAISTQMGFPQHPTVQAEGLRSLETVPIFTYRASAPPGQ